MEIFWSRQNEADRKSPLRRAAPMRKRERCRFSV
jgi:hypothetical protein